MLPVTPYRTFLATIFLTGLLVNADEPAWQTKFNELYRLADTENAKLIRPPFTAERDAFHTKSHPGIANHPGQYGFRWKGGKVHQRRWSSDSGTVATALLMADIDVADLDGVRDLFSVKVAGDWIVRDGASRKDIVADIQREVTKSTEGRIQIEPAQVERDVVVARGRFELKPLDNAPRNSKSVHLFTNTLDSQEGAGGGTGTMTDLLRRIGDVIGQKVINETEPRKGNVTWTNNMDADKAAESEENRDKLLKIVSQQTGLEFKVERRKLDVWRVIDTTGNAGGL